MYCNIGQYDTCLSNEKMHIFDEKYLLLQRKPSVRKSILKKTPTGPLASINTENPEPMPAANSKDRESSSLGNNKRQKEVTYDQKQKTARKKSDTNSSSKEIAHTKNTSKSDASPNQGPEQKVTLPQSDTNCKPSGPTPPPPPPPPAPPAGAPPPPPAPKVREVSVAIRIINL